MKKHPFLVLVLAVLVSFGGGYYLGHQSPSVNDRVNTPASMSRSSVVLTAAPAVTRAPSPQETPVQYVLNTNTKKFHYSYCSSVGQMKAKNRKIVTWSRQEIISKGYKPCKICNP